MCITEGIPVLDMVRVKRALQDSKTSLGPIAPPGIITHPRPVNAKWALCQATFINLEQSASYPAQAHSLMKRLHKQQP